MPCVRRSTAIRQNEPVEEAPELAEPEVELAPANNNSPAEQLPATGTEQQRIGQGRAHSAQFMLTSLHASLSLDDRFHDVLT
jgi:hypothetical protein